MSFANLVSVVGQLESIDARLDAIARRKLPPLGPYIAQLGLVSSRLTALADQVEHLPPVPGGYVNREEPSSIPRPRPSDIFQPANAPPPPGFTRSDTGGLLPGLPTSARTGLSGVPASPAVGHEFAAAPWENPLFDIHSRELSEALGIRGPGGTTEEVARVEAQLRQLQERLQAAFGDDNYFAALIEKYLVPLREGVLTPAQVLDAIQGYLSPFYERIQRESQTMTGELRAVAEQLLGIIRTGQAPSSGPTHFGTLTPFGGGLTPGPRPAPTSAADEREAITATIAARTAGVVREEVTGLGATFTRGVESQADRVLAGVNERTGAVLSTVSAQSAALRTIREEQVRANRELAEQYHEIGRTTIRVDEGVRALGRNQLSAAALRDELERLNLSGRLGVA